MAHPSFISTGLPARLHCTPWEKRNRTQVAKCTAQPPNDATNLRSESERRRNQPPKLMRRRRRRRQIDDPLDWDKLPSVPLVRPEATPESGEDYWMEMERGSVLEGAVADSEDVANKSRKPKKEIDDRLRERLKQEVVSPYTQNWILWAGVIVLVLVVLVAVFGGEDSVPIIAVPDL